MEIRLRAPGSTSNLGPGFDTLGLALSLHNRMTVRTASHAGADITVTGEGAGVLPRDKTNLFYRAASAAASKAGRALPGLDVEMHNEVPVARGLGSSATAIVAGLVTANHLLGRPLSEPELLALATEIEGHPDNVSACLKGGFTICSTSGQQTDCLRTLPPAELRAVVAIPRFELETRTARAALPKQVSHREAVTNVSRACLLTAALAIGDLEMLGKATQDRLHEPYRAPFIPGFEAVLSAARDAGASGTCLSGAGPSLLAFATGRADRVRQAMVETWHREGVEAIGLVLEVDTNGVVIE